MEMVQVNVSINLNSISDKFTDKMKLNLESLNKYEFQIPFFLPKLYRKEGTESEKLISTEMRSSITEKITEWLEYQFPARFRPGSASIIASHVTAYVEFCCPQFSMNSSEFECVVKSTAIPLLIDFFADRKELFENHDDDEFINGVQLLVKIFQEGIRQGADLLGDESQTEFFKLEEIHDNKFASMFLGVVSDLVFETFETFDIGGKTEEWKNYLKKMFANAMIGFSSRNGEISDCSVNTFRFFRSMGGTLAQLMEIVVMLKECILSGRVSEDPIFLRFSGLVNEISASLNDLLGLQKDVRNGEEEGGIILWRVQKGTDFKVVLDEEVAVLKENIRDYGMLRNLLLTKYGNEDGNLQDYLNITDSVLFGMFQVFAESDVYGMKDQIRIDMD